MNSSNDNEDCVYLARKLNEVKLLTYLNKHVCFDSKNNWKETNTRSFNTFIIKDTHHILEEAESSTVIRLMQSCGPLESVQHFDGGGNKL